MQELNKSQQHLRVDPEIKVFIMKNSKEMSVEELAIETGLSPKKVKDQCTKIGCSYFSELEHNWKKKGYIEGTNGYAMYPYKGSYRESASVSNAQLKGVKND